GKDLGAAEEDARRQLAGSGTVTTTEKADSGTTAIDVEGAENDENAVVMARKRLADPILVHSAIRATSVTHTPAKRGFFGIGKRAGRHNVVLGNSAVVHFRVCQGQPTAAVRIMFFE